MGVNLAWEEGAELGELSMVLEKGGGHLASFKRTFGAY